VSLAGVAEVVAALRAGGLAVLPTDTVYGLVADGESEPAAHALYAAKGRDAIQPTALLFASVRLACERIPGLAEREARLLEELLPGPLTLVVSNPRRRYAWLSTGRPEAIGVRVPALAGAAREILDALGVLVATSANLPGGPDPRRLVDVPAEICAAAQAVVDGGELPGTPSTVVDLTGTEARVIREGAVPAAEVLRIVNAGPART
jgi:L-threonylcarbamoyladenylate synthase